MQHSAAYSAAYSVSFLLRSIPHALLLSALFSACNMPHVRALSVLTHTCLCVCVCVCVCRYQWAQKHWCGMRTAYTVAGSLFCPFLYIREHILYTYMNENRHTYAHAHAEWCFSLLIEHVLICFSFSLNMTSVQQPNTTSIFPAAPCPARRLHAPPPRIPPCPPTPISRAQAPNGREREVFFVFLLFVLFFITGA